MTWLLKYYECSECGAKWTDEWSCACNDRCPSCRAETEPYDDKDLTYFVESVAPGTFTVMFSPDTAESSANKNEKDHASHSFLRRWSQRAQVSISRPITTQTK